MIDHLIFATTDLESTVAWFEEATGVRPTPGGPHIGLGTRNELVSLGDGGYIELVGPDLGQPEPGRPRPFGIDAMDGQRLVTWAVQRGDLDVYVADARAAGYDPGDPIDLARERPDGVVLRWRLTGAARALGDGVVPFLIDWGDTPHPSTTSTGGVRLAAFTAEHPDPGAVRPLLAALGVDLEVRAGPVPALIATLETPKGTVTLQ